MTTLTHKQNLQLRLRTLLLIHQMSYQDLAKVVGSSRQSVHQTLNSESVSLDKIISLAEDWGFGVILELEE